MNRLQLVLVQAFGPTGRTIGNLGFRVLLMTYRSLHRAPTKCKNFEIDPDPWVQVFFRLYRSA